MKKAALGLACVLVAFAFGFPSVDVSAGKAKKRGGTKGNLEPPPASLDKLYPPKSPQPVFLFEMLALGSSFNGIVVDLFENDAKNAMANFEKFKQQYQKVSKLVPVWRKLYPLGPVNSLGSALKSGNQKKVMEAVEKVGKVCADCHYATMDRVLIRYHWKDFSQVKIEDPLTKKEMPHSEFKHHLDASFSGILVDIQENQKDNALRQYEGFKQRFGALEESCTDCHDSERKYYVGDSIQPLVDQLGKALSAPQPDPGAVGKLIQGIGMQSCFKCHSVHVPAALIRGRWDKQ